MNSGYRDALVVVDVFSCDVSVEPLKRKNPTDVLAAYKKIVGAAVLREGSARTGPGVQERPQFSSLSRELRTSSRTRSTPSPWWT
jgi:hypothetical protein